LIRKGLILKYGIIAVLFLIIFTPGPGVFGLDQASAYVPDNEYVESLVRKSKEMRLGDDPYWHRLLHYMHGVVGYRSIVDDPAFFLSEDGKRFPEKELEATIRAFFAPQTPDKMHPGSKFIARFDWLNEKLSFDKTKLPLDFEKKFDDFYNKVKPSKAILVFPAGYINSPASMYGHTLLVLEPSNGNRLSALAVNYAARTDDSFGPLFAFRGLFGLYDGYYSILPYYEKINEYSNGEMRDMWEYTLDFNEKQVRRTLMHIVEMEKIGSRYFFLDENCSFNLLCLFEVARPDADLTSRFKTTIEPIDTLRALLDSGLVVKREYRPSLYAKIQRMASDLPRGTSVAAIDYCKGNIDEAAFDREADGASSPSEVYDFASDYLKFLAVKEGIDQDNYRKRILHILRKRSALPPGGKDFSSDAPPPPETSHRSNKLSLSYGRFDSKGFMLLSPAICRAKIHNNATKKQPGFHRVFFL
jgi:hypothetical protein